MNATPKNYLCMLCAKMQPKEQNNGFCPIHPDEPLLDVSKDEVKYQLMEADDHARNKVYSFWLVVTVTPAFLLACLPTLYGIKGGSKLLILFACALAAALGTGIAKWRFKPRYRKWTADIDKH